uniref:Putative product n=1 Tax=Xenopsylla cheopis TaxID=163159 RepID=A0A6M2DT41_XENCH
MSNPSENARPTDNFSFASRGQSEDAVNTTALNLAIKLIPKFDGNPSELNKFLYTVDKIRFGVNLATDAEITKIACTKLEGPAFNYIRLSSELFWDDIRSLLLHKFGERRSLPELQLELVGLRQKQGQSVRSFANEIERLLGLMYDQALLGNNNTVELLQPVHCQLALKVFIDGLHPELRLLMKAARHTDFQDAVQMAVQEESTLRSRSHRTIQDQQPYHQQRRPIMPFCSHCRRHGHVSANCRRRGIFRVNHDRDRADAENMRAIQHEGPVENQLPTRPMESQTPKN